MARDFWSKGVVSRGLRSSSRCSRVLRRPPQSPAVLETCWRQLRDHIHTRFRLQGLDCDRTFQFNPISRDETKPHLEAAGRPRTAPRGSRREDHASPKKQTRAIQIVGTRMSDHHLLPPRLMAMTLEAAAATCKTTHNW